MALLVPHTFMTRALSPERRSVSLRVLILQPLSRCSCLMNAPWRPMMRDDACAVKSSVKSSPNQMRDKQSTSKIQASVSSCVKDNGVPSQQIHYRHSQQRRRPPPSGHSRNISIDDIAENIFRHKQITVGAPRRGS